MLRRGSWRIPARILSTYPSLAVELKNVKLTKEEDKILFLDSERFTIAKAYQSLVQQRAEQKWARVIWDPISTPKHRLIAWLVCTGKLSTRAHLARRGLNIPQKCSFCSENETTDHLFFRCIYTKKVWEAVCLWSGMKPPSALSWSSLIGWAGKRFKGRNGVSTMRRVAFLATIYFIWRARNTYTFRGVCLTQQQTLHNIQSDVLLRLHKSKALTQKCWYEALTKHATYINLQQAGLC